MADPLTVHIGEILRAIAATNAAEVAKLEQLEAAGNRIVGGGQIDGDRWEITDWRTGEQLAAGNDGLDGYDVASDRLDPGGTWIHIDQALTGENDDPLAAPYDVPAADGIPSSLSSALIQWVEAQDTPLEEIAQVAGWPEGEVERCLRGVVDAES